MQKKIIILSVVTAVLLVVYFSTNHTEAGKTGEDLQGAWRGKVQLNSGIFSDVKDLKFMYVFNGGGTMTESSNYDSYPPGPPAYGIWKRTGKRQFESKYLVAMTKADSILDQIKKGGGWVPDGYQVLTERMTLSDDGDSFKSTIKFELYDQNGNLTTKGGEGVVIGTRIKF